MSFTSALRPESPSISPALSDVSPPHHSLSLPALPCLDECYLSSWSLSSPPLVSSRQAAVQSHNRAPEKELHVWIKLSRNSAPSARDELGQPSGECLVLGPCVLCFRASESTQPAWCREVHSCPEGPPYVMEESDMQTMPFSARLKSKDFWYTTEWNLPEM